MNWGGFAGGLVTGVERGMHIGKNLRDVLKEKAREDVIAKAKSEAEAGYNAQSAASGGMSPGGAPDTSPDNRDVGQPDPAATPATPATAATDAATSAASPTASPDPAAAATSAALLPVNPEQAAATGQASGTGEQASNAAPAPADVAQPANSVVQKQPDAVAIEPGEAWAPKTSEVAAGGLAGMPARSTKATASQDTERKAEFVQRKIAQGLQQHYIEQGDPEMAKKWGDYAESSKGKAAIRDWSKAWNAPDMESALKGFGKYYTDHIDDGLDYKSSEVITKSDGTQVGVVTLLDKATGKEQKMELTRERMLQLGGANNPQALFEMEQKRQTEAEKIKVQAKIKAAERADRRQEAIYKEDRADLRAGTKHQNKLSEITLTKQLDAENLGEKERARVNGKVQTLKDAGYSDDEIKGFIPALVGAGDHKKTTDPTERRALIQSDLAKNDPTWGRKSEADKAKAVDEGMRIVYGGTTSGGAPAGGKPAPAAGAKPADGVLKAPPAAKEGDIVTQKSTGKQFRTVNGALVPLNAVQPPAPAPAQTPAKAAAGGLPQPAPAPAPAPAAPAAPVSRVDALTSVLNPGGNPAVGKVMAERAGVIAGAADQVQMLEEKMRQAAASGDNRVITQAAAELGQARQGMEAMLQQFEPGMRKAIMATLAR